ncbi:hypothetical protein O3M35_012589 [Rhynocoris fuscipes]|uniref:Gustatory receptor n=1 Tax=Rhynocoris fuscipes TaxID=488301 RepID=A0AAW1CU60_9HEMI
MVRLVKTSLSSLVLFSKCLGIFPYHISTNNGVTFSVTFAIWSILLNILLSYGSFLAILTPAEFEINAIYDGLMNVQFVSLQFALNLHVIWLIIYRKELQNAFTVLINLEEIEPLNKKLSLKYPLLCYSIIIFMFFNEFMIFSYDSSYDIITSILYHIQAAFLFSATYQFTGLLSICRKGFRAMIKILKDKFHSVDLPYLIDNYDQLITCCELINICYGPLLLIALISFFVIITTNLYIAYLYWPNTEDILLSLSWAFLYLNSTRYLANSCWRTVEITKQFYYLLYKQLIKYEDRYQDSYNRLTVDFLNKRELKFTAFGYFSIDYGMICTMVGTSATYLIIFIQFSTKPITEDQPKDYLNLTDYENSTSNYDNYTM